MDDANSNVVSRTYKWWLGELAQALTPQRPSASEWRTLLRNTPEGLDISTRPRKSVKHVGMLKPEAAPDEVASMRRLVMQVTRSKAGQVRLRLSPGDVVERTIQIPEAASDVIGPVLQNQMERIVPWSPEETNYGFRVVGPNASSPDQLDIQVIATTKSILNTALRRARSVGLEPDVIDFASDSEGTSAIELMSLAPDPVKKTEKTLQTFLAIVLVAGMTVGAFGLYHMWNRQAQNDELAAKIAVARSRVEEVKRLNEENAQLREQRERLVRRKAQEPVVMVLIEALSRALPDTAYLTELEVHGSDTRIVGKSDDPTALITMLEATPQFEDVRFSAATTREEGETAGTFSIISRALGAPLVEKKP